MTLTTAQLGLVLLAAAIMAFAFGVFATIRVMALILGIILISATGTPGRVFHWAAGLVGWGSNVTDSLTGWAFGVALPGLFALLLAAKVAYDLHPRGGRASRATFWCAAGLAVMIAAGSTSVPFLNQVGPAITHGVQQAKNGG